MGISLFSGLVSIELLDSMACALMSAAVLCRGMTMGANLMGAIVLGCICGLAGPLARELLIHGHAGMSMVMEALPDDAVIGVMGGFVACRIARQNLQKLFIWLDAAGIGLAGALGAVMGMPGMGVAGGIVMGLVNALSPGLLRDVALGDIAMLAEKNWYAASAIIACVLALLIVMLPHLAGFPEGIRLGEWGVLAGMCVCIGLRVWKGDITD